MTNTNVKVLLRSIPPMEELLNADWAAGFSAQMGREQVKKIITEAIDEISQELSHATGTYADVMSSDVSVGELIAIHAMALLKLKSSSTLKPVVNATGVVIHKNLGRTPLADEALQAVNALAGCYNTLEYSLEKGWALG